MTRRKKGAAEVAPSVVGDVVTAAEAGTDENPETQSASAEAGADEGSETVQDAVAEERPAVFVLTKAGSFQSARFSGFRAVRGQPVEVRDRSLADYLRSTSLFEER